MSVGEFMRRLRGWIGPLALVLSVISLLQDHSQSDRLDLVQRLTTGMSFRPHLTLTCPPVLDNLDVAPVAIVPTSHGKDELLANVNARFTIHLFNSGNARARLVRVLYGDTLTGEPAFRNLIKKPSFKDKITFAARPTFYTPREVEIGDTMDLHVPVLFGVNEGAEYVLHLLIVYQNDSGQLYDTYYWARFTASPRCAARHWVSPTSFFVTIDSTTFRDSIRLLDTNESSVLYREDDARLLLKAVKGES